MIHAYGDDLSRIGSKHCNKCFDKMSSNFFNTENIYFQMRSIFNYFQIQL